MDDKAQLEQEHSTQMNEAAQERVRAEAQAEMRKSEAIWFEEDEKITLRDGKEYSIPPLTFADARIFAQLTQTVDIHAIIMNFATRDNVQYQNLVTMMKMAFKQYPEIDDNFIDQYVDLRLAAKIVEVMINLNGLKN